MWFAFFGGSLHSPVTTFFYLQLEATNTEIGWIGTYMDIGSLLAVGSYASQLNVQAPLAGRLMDKYGAHLAISAGCFFCALGCLLRGLAHSIPQLYTAAMLIGLGSFHTTVLRYFMFPGVVTLNSLISNNTPRSKRTLVVGGYLIQLTVLSLVGKVLYPLWHEALEALLLRLGMFSELLRDRITMSICSMFCIVGFIVLLFDDPKKYNNEPLAEEVDLESLEGQPVEKEKNVRVSFTMLGLSFVLLGTFVS